MKYCPCKNKTEFLTLLVMAEKNGWTIDGGSYSAEEYAEKYWNGRNNFGISGEIAVCYKLNLANLPYGKEISFQEMAAILLKTEEPQITKKDLADYVCGWLAVDLADPNFSNLSLKNIKAALHNAAFCLDCPNDGIEAYVKRRAAQS